MDNISYNILSKIHLNEVCPISLEDFESKDEELKKTKNNRSIIEYYFTCTPSLPLYIMNHNPDVKLLTYLDADVFFFSDPTPIYDEIAENSIAIIPHRFPAKLYEKEKWGHFNVGWISFKSDSNSITCLHWWRDRCLEWCYDRYENGLFADQKYLDQWPHLFKGIIILQHKGANLAPWNIENYNYCIKDEKIWVDEQPLIFFHFHGIYQINKWIINSGFKDYQARLPLILRYNIFKPYIIAIMEENKKIAPFIRFDTIVGKKKRQKKENILLSYNYALKNVMDICKQTLAGNYLFINNNKVI